MIKLTLRSNLGQIRQKYAARTKAIDYEVTKELHVTSRKLIARARKMSSGPFTTAWLRAQAQARGAGLYSRRAPAPPDDPAIINVQTGQFRAAWRSKIYRRPNSLNVNLTNESYIAEWLLKGTRKMIPRPILEAVQNAEKRDHQQRVAAAKRRALRK